MTGVQIQPKYAYSLTHTSARARTCTQSDNRDHSHTAGRPTDLAQYQSRTKPMLKMNVNSGPIVLCESCVGFCLLRHSPRCSRLPVVYYIYFSFAQENATLSFRGLTAVWPPRGCQCHCAPRSDDKLPKYYYICNFSAVCCVVVVAAAHNTHHTHTAARRAYCDHRNCRMIHWLVIEVPRAHGYCLFTLGLSAVFAVVCEHRGLPLLFVMPFIESSMRMASFNK